MGYEEDHKKSGWESSESNMTVSDVSCIALLSLIVFYLQECEHSQSDSADTHQHKQHIPGKESVKHIKQTVNMINQTQNNTQKYRNSTNDTT